MAKKKKRSRSEKKKETTKEEQPREKAPKQQEQPLAERGMVITGIYALFGVLFLLLIWSGHAAYVKGNYPQILLLAVALAAFLMAVLSRRLQDSGYFFFYRVISIIFFILVAVAFFFQRSLDGFMYALICIVASTLLLGSLLPFLVKEIEISKIIIACVSLLVVGLFSMLMIATKFEPRRKPTLKLEMLRPVSMAIDRDGKHVWIVGMSPPKEDGKKNELKIYRKLHPYEYLVKEAEKHLAEIKHFADRKNKKEKKEDKNNKGVETGGPEFSAQAGNFNWSFSRDRQDLAVAASKEKGSNNTLFKFNFHKNERKDLAEDGTREFFFPWKSRTFPGYSTWAPGGKKFFVFSNTGDKATLMVSDTETGKNVEIDRKDVLSATWTADDKLVLVCGEKKPLKLTTKNSTLKKNFEELMKAYHFGMFDFEADGITIHTWQVGDSKTVKTATIKGSSMQVKVHPETGTILAFDGQKIIRFNGGEGKTIEVSGFSLKPSPASSGLSFDCKKMLMQKGRDVIMVNLEDGKQKVIESSADRLMHVYFSRDGRYILYNLATDIDSQFIQLRCILKVYNIETGQLDRIFLNVFTTQYMAFNWFPMACFDDPERHEIYFYQYGFKNKFLSGEFFTRIWMIYPPRINMVQEKPSPSPTPTASPAASPTKKLKPVEKVTSVDTPPTAVPTGELKPSPVVPVPTVSPAP